MPKQSSNACAHSCPHFDTSSNEVVTKYLNVLAKIRLQRITYQLNPAAKTSLLTALGIKVVNL